MRKSVDAKLRIIAARRAKIAKSHLRKGSSLKK